MKQMSSSQVNQTVEPNSTCEANETSGMNISTNNFIDQKFVNIINNPNAFLICVNVRISDSVCKPVMALIDTGSSFSLMSEKLFKSNNLPIINNDVSFNVIGGNFKSLGLTNSEIYIGQILLNPHQFHIFSQSDNAGIDLLLGSDLLTKYNFEVSVSEKLIIKHSPDGSRVEQYFGCDGKLLQTLYCSIPCYAVNTVKLNPQSVNVVKVDYNLKLPVHETNLFFSTSVKNVKSRNEIAAIDGVFNSESKIVLLTNHENDCLIKKGDMIGTVSSILELDDEMLNDESHDNLNFSIENKVDLTGLDESQKCSIYNMLKDSNISKVFSKDESDIGLARVAQHKIRVTDDSPICARPRRFPKPVSDEIESQCATLRSLGIIEPSDSSWNSALVPIRKKDGSTRLCVDYRQLNNVTINDKFPLPNLQDSIFGLHGSKYFTTLDLVKSYYQIPVEPSSRKYTAFSTPKGLWQFARMPFGLKNAPASFQREISSVLGSFPSKNVLCYLDDILILSSNFEEHLKLVREVLFTLAKFGLKINLNKCEFFKDKVKYLGHIVSEEGIRKTEDYVKQITNYPQPNTVGELRAFLGLINFQRKFLPHASELQKPLSACTGGRRSRKLVWSEEMLHSFEALKREMQNDLCLAYPDYSDNASKLELWVDASALGAGAYLSQRQGDSHRVLGFASVTFNKAQLNYSTIERELCALRFGIKTFRAFLYGVDFVLNTDHMPLIHLFNMKIICSRLARTVQELSEFTFTINYVPGKLNCAADTLSRLHAPKVPIEQTESDSIPAGYVLDGYPVPGGGDSLFISLFKCLSRENFSNLPADPLELRVKLVDELLNNANDYNIKLDRNSRKELRLMKFKNQLPCLEVLMAASKLYSVRIYVYFWPQQPVVYQYSDNYQSSVYLQSIGCIHFNPLVKISDKTTQISCATPYIYTSPNNLTASESCSGNSPGIVGDIPDSEDEHCFQIMSKDKNNYCYHESNSQPIARINFNNCKLCAVLDTGSEISLITEEALDLLGKHGIEISKVQDRICDIVGFSGEKIPITHFTNLSFYFNNLSVQCFKFAVVPANTFSNCMILGLDFLVPNRVSINMYDNHINIRKSCDLSDTNNSVIDSSDTPKTLDVLAMDVQNNPQLSLSMYNNDFRFVMTGGGSSVSGFSLAADDQTIIYLQQSCPVLSLLKRHIKANVPIKQWPAKICIYKRCAGKIKLVNGILVNTSSGKYLMPFKVLCHNSLKLHNEFAHVGRDKLIALLNSIMFHPSIHKVASDVCRCCHKCQLMKVCTPVTVPPTLKIQTSRPYELVAADLLSLPHTISGYVGCLVVVDHYTKWGTAIPIKDKRSSTIIHALKYYVFPSFLNLPRRLLSDNGKEFTSDEFEDFLEGLGITHQLTTPYHPASNGAVERLNRTLQGVLRSLVESPDDWDDKLPRAIRVYNSTYHAELKSSPSEFLMSKSHDSGELPIMQLPNSTWRPGHPCFEPFKIGQLVLRKVQRKGFLTTNKFLNRFSGPMRIVKSHPNNVTYVLVDENNNEIEAHHSQLRRYNILPKYLERLKLSNLSPDYESDSSEVQQPHYEFVDTSLEDSSNESIPAGFPVMCYNKKSSRRRHKATRNKVSYRSRQNSIALNNDLSIFIDCQNSDVGYVPILAVVPQEYSMPNDFSQSGSPVQSHNTIAEESVIPTNVSHNSLPLITPAQAVRERLIARRNWVDWDFSPQIIEEVAGGSRVNGDEDVNTYNDTPHALSEYSDSNGSKLNLTSFDKYVTDVMNRCQINPQPIEGNRNQQSNNSELLKGASDVNNNDDTGSEIGDLRELSGEIPSRNFSPPMTRSRAKQLEAKSPIYSPPVTRSRSKLLNKSF